MPDNKVISHWLTAVACSALVALIVLIAWIIVSALPISQNLAFLSASNGQTFTKSLFDATVIVSTFLITIAPVTFSTLFEKENEKNKTNLRKYLRDYMIASIVVLLVAVVFCSIWIAETRYASSTELSLLLLFIVTIGYFFLCFPVRKAP